MPVKTMFCLFQHIWDRLYLTPPSLDEHTGSSSAYLGALGFTKPQEKKCAPLYTAEERPRVAREAKGSQFGGGHHVWCT